MEDLFYYFFLVSTSEVWEMLVHLSEGRGGGVGGGCSRHFRIGERCVPRGLFYLQTNADIYCIHLAFLYKQKKLFLSA